MFLGLADDDGDPKLGMHSPTIGFCGGVAPLVCPITGPEPITGTATPTLLLSLFPEEH